MIAPDIVGRLERVEVAGLADIYRMMPPAYAAAERIGARWFGSALGIRAARADVLAFNRVVGLGVAEPATTGVLDAALGWFRDAGVPRAFVQVAPHAEPALLAAWLQARGLTYYNNWIRLWRDTTPLPPQATTLRVEQVGVDRAETFARIFAEAFHVPLDAGRKMTSTVGRPGWRHYMAFDGETPVATATLFLMGDSGWLSAAATSEAARGRGAQSALIARRIADAHAAGATLLSVETAEPTATREAPSYRNVTRLGFEVAYKRANWLWVRKW
jgi:hypothetical protein